MSVGKGRCGEMVENMCTVNMQLVTQIVYVLSTGQEDCSGKGYEMPG